MTTLISQLMEERGYNEPALLTWANKTGAQSNEPFTVQISQDVARDYAREAREKTNWIYKKAMPGFTVSLITARETYTQRFYIKDGIWRPGDEEETDGIDWLRDLPPYKSTSEAITAMQKAIQDERTQDEYEHDIMPRDEVLAGLLECVAYELLPSGKDRENILVVLDMYCGKPVEDAK